MAYQQPWEAARPVPFGDDVSEPNLVIAEKDPGLNNCWQFRIEHEDHTLGNMLCQKLLEEERVLFAGYRIHHPLDDWILLRVQVEDNITKPSELVNTAITNLVAEIDRLSIQFGKELNRHAKNPEGDRRHH
jgi:DNA-directed RNA polymerase II subunit RPB11